MGKKKRDVQNDHEGIFEERGFDEQMNDRGFLDDFDKYTCGQCVGFCRDEGDARMGECVWQPDGIKLPADTEACPDCELF